jgi:hypothetical protein
MNSLKAQKRPKNYTSFNTLRWITCNNVKRYTQTSKIILLLNKNKTKLLETCPCCFLCNEEKINLNFGLCLAHETNGVISAFTIVCKKLSGKEMLKLSILLIVYIYKLSVFYIGYYLSYCTFFSKC